jgi:hypothetical protein
LTEIPETKKSVNNDLILPGHSSGGRLSHQLPDKLIMEEGFSKADAVEDLLRWRRKKHR